ncbi:MAG TPA: beta-galactosidase [Candidatus Acidoferrales bacterium]|nr:beta-galactosidase [Candidatus Acidoferrales bacterium]
MNKSITNTVRLLIGIMCFLVPGCLTVHGDNVPSSRPFAHPDRIRYDSQCLSIDGKDVFIYSGAFHYFRCPKELWPDRFQKIKDAGFNTVETYVPWNWCEREMPGGTNDFSKLDLKDFNDWLDMAEHFGFYIIVRPGPYICSEWSTGGFPQWLLNKKPPRPLRSLGWLRSDDPVFLAWSKHWYDAVCPVIARHQITRKPAGQAGVILVQVENEYDFGLPFSDEVKENHLRTLVTYARADGIDVPLISCWTHQIRGQTDPLLRQVFDCCNFYPRWDVHGILPDIRKLRNEQPDAPLTTTELQGGWFAQVGGKLSEDQEGVTASQINNLTLFTIQNGETILNYYMLFGGTNPDDWAARDIISSYDYNAPIRESGGVGDRYQAVRAIGQMLQKYGSDLARSRAVPCKVTTSQNDVKIVERRAVNGGRFFFIRTSQHTDARQGTATVTESAGGKLVFDYQLEPFGSKILYLPPGANDPSHGEWLPEPALPIQRPNASDLPKGVIITTAKACPDPGPARWKKLRPGESLDQAGVYDSHFLFYKTKISCAVPTNLLVEIPNGDSVLAIINARLARVSTSNGSNSIFDLSAGANTIELLYENHGYGNGGDKMEKQGGIIRACLTDGDSDDASIRPNLPLKHFGRPAGDDKQWWAPGLHDARWRDVSIGERPEPSPKNSVLTWYRMRFSLQSPHPGIWAPWRLHLMAAGNGFLYLNGHPLGRYWDVGPQHDFFLPECWLNFGDSSTNVLTLNLRPTANGAWIRYAGIEPYSEFAEIK